MKQGNAGPREYDDAIKFVAGFAFGFAFFVAIFLGYLFACTRSYGAGNPVFGAPSVSMVKTAAQVALISTPVLGWLAVNGIRRLAGLAGTEFYGGVISGELILGYIMLQLP
ncbi:MAG: hypothetical protein V1708_04315 [Candidatus Micrarchaeota archaeon]